MKLSDLSNDELYKYARMIVCAMIFKDKNVDLCEDCKYLKLCLKETQKAVNNVLQVQKNNEWRKELKHK